MNATTEMRMDLATQWKVRRFKKVLGRHTESLNSRFGASEADAIRREMLAEYGPIIPQVPYVGGRRNRYTPGLAMSAWALAIYRVLLRHGGTVQDAGEILHNYAKSTYQRIPRSLRARMLRPRKARAEKQAKWTQQRRYPGDWLNAIVEGDGRTFDWGIDITECGMVKFFHAQGADELTPYMCDLDYVMAEAAGVGLTRTKTLAWGCDSCDFRWRIPGDTIATWPPTFSEQRCGMARSETTDQGAAAHS
ncbi:MAG TPA: L-2-amino-thiazoline-4-carboxylic acid hydrolase [Propionicimonas sp.]|jgi:hypothetical protein